MSRLILKGPVLITGSRGMLGTDFVEYLKKNVSEIKVLEPLSVDLDITQKNQVNSFLKKYRPEWIINTAAYTEVDRAESERDRAFQVNVEGPKYLAETATEIGAKLVHFSTDYVFDGTGDRPWTEKDKAHPVQPNWYAETKLMGEKFVLENSQHLVFRVQWLYGKKKERFSALKSREVFTPFVDQFGAPTWTQDVVQIVLAVMTKNGSGLFHLAYDDYASWFEVYEFIKHEWKLPVSLVPKKASEVSLPAKRPLNGRLLNQKLKTFLAVSSLGSWRESLGTFLKQVQQ